MHQVQRHYILYIYIASKCLLLDYGKLKKAKLQALCKDRHLSEEGDKAQLRLRLQENDAEPASVLSDQSWLFLPTWS